MEYTKKLWPFLSSNPLAYPDYYLCVDQVSKEYVDNQAYNVKTLLLGDYIVSSDPKFSISTTSQLKKNTLSILTSLSMRDYETRHLTKSPFNSPHLKWYRSQEYSAFKLFLDVCLQSNSSLPKSYSFTQRTKPHDSPSDANISSQPSLLDDLLKVNLVTSACSTLNIHAASLGIPSVWLSRRLMPSLPTAYPHIFVFKEDSHPDEFSDYLLNYTPSNTPITPFNPSILGSI